MEEDTRQGIWRDAEAAKEQEAIQQLQLVQLRLTDPLAIIAEHFLGHDSKRQEISTAPIHARGLSTPRNVMDLFDAERPDTLRVEVGLIDRQEGKRRLGLRLRKNDALVTDTEKGG
ncbi:hypothetical protein FRC02_001604 [Tulasnella sp. 418]|nr:hypothetical protein FRC02_001604 [Tulasnella sp. 418]